MPTTDKAPHIVWDISQELVPYEHALKVMEKRVADIHAAWTSTPLHSRDILKIGWFAQPK